MKKITTSSGFEIEIDENIADDMRILDAVAAVSKGDMLHMPCLVDRILGSRKEDFYKHIETEDGRVPMKLAFEEITEMFNLMGDKGKN